MRKWTLKKIISMFEDVGYHETREIKDVKFTLLPAGHIPGSASILIEADGERLLYSGDINSNETKLLKGAETNIEKY